MQKNTKRHLSLEEHSSRYQMMALSSSPCGFCGGFGGSFNGLRWNKALLRVLPALDVHEELESERGSTNSLCRCRF